MVPNVSPVHDWSCCRWAAYIQSLSLSLWLRELVCNIVSYLPAYLYWLRLSEFSFLLIDIMDSVRLFDLLNFWRSGVVLLTTDGAAVACGFDDWLGPLSYVETRVTTMDLLVLVDALIVKAEAVYHCLQAQAVLFEQHRIQTMKHSMANLEQRIHATRVEIQKTTKYC